MFIALKNSRQRVQAVPIKLLHLNFVCLVRDERRFVWLCIQSLVLDSITLSVLKDKFLPGTSLTFRI